MLRGVKSILLAAVLSAVIFFARKEPGNVGISNACALSGICFLILALFRRARYLRFYDLLFYGFQKFIQIWKNHDFRDRDGKRYADFLESRKYEKNDWEAFIAAVGMFACALAVLGI